MRRAGILVFAAVAALAAARMSAQVVVDRIAARLDTDIILLSEVRALSRYQQLVDGKSENDAQVLDRLIDQWIVRNEADTAQFRHPSAAEIDGGVERLEKSFATQEEYQTRKRQSGLSDGEIRSMVAAQLYLSNYLDSRFRPAVQVDAKQIQDFYDKEILSRAQARGQKPPTLDAAAHDYIQEALVQRGIDEQAERWLSESRGRVHVQKFLDEGTK